MEKKECQKYTNRKCLNNTERAEIFNSWTKADLYGFFERLNRPYNPKWSKKRLCQELDKMCRLLWITPEIILPKSRRTKPIEFSDSALKSVFDKMYTAQEKDRQKIISYCRQLKTLTNDELEDPVYEPFLIEIDQFIKRIVKHYQLDPKELSRHSDKLAIEMNCDYLKQMLSSRIKD